MDMFARDAVDRVAGLPVMGGTMVAECPAHAETSAMLNQLLDQKTGCDEHAISFAIGVKIDEAKAAIEQIEADQLPFDPAAFRPLAEKLKFHDTLAEPRIAELVQASCEALDEVRKILAEPTIEAS
jgi:hypothetical protein